MAAINKRILLLLILRRRLQQIKTKRTARFWIREIYKRRKLRGEFHCLVKEAALSDHEYFFKLFRMSPRRFELLLSWVGPLIKKSNIRRETIEPDERLCITLRYLITGDAFSTISASYRVGETTVSRIVMETCKTIWWVLLQKGFIQSPKTKNEWSDVARDFETLWNFPNCVGAIDGKHVRIQCPNGSGSLYFNYKKYFSIVLMAVVNAKYQFTLLDIGDYGRISDASVFSSSDLGYSILNQTFDLPYPRKLPGSNKYFPYVFVGDDAFPLRKNLVKPYPRSDPQEKKVVANYRISRARRVVENAFGIATSRFRLFSRPINASVELAEEATKAVVALHNFLIHNTNETRKNYCPNTYVDHEYNGDIIPGEWRNQHNNNGLVDINNTGNSNNYTRNAKQVRDDFCNYFYSPEGSVPWQLNRVRCTREEYTEN